MKKLLVLLTVAVGIFAFSAGVFAQTSTVCISCGKCALGILPCPTATQGSTAVCTYFDYETGYGYLSGRSALDNCRAVFAICNCPDAGTNFVEGHTIGIRMTIMVNGQYGQRGAYWSAPGDANIEFAKFATSAAACASTLYDSNFGPGKWYKSDASGTSTTEVTTLYGGTSCTVPDANQATMIVTDPDAGYTITAYDQLTKLSYWLIDIPPIRISSSVLHNCEVISVKIETLDQSSGGICRDCNATCECIIDVAKVCCETPTMGSCLFPYFTSTTEPTSSQPWWNGIAIVNTGSTAGTATLTVHQQDGATGTYTTPSIPAGSIFVRTLDSIAFTGSGLGDLPLWIDVVTTFSLMDGFAIIGNTTSGESMGYLCRKSCN